MNLTKDAEQKTKSLHELDDILGKAIQKVNGTKDEDLCKFLPMATGGYMHHFTLRKMKQKNPKELASMVDQYILNNERPTPIASKTRAPRGSRKSSVKLIFSREQLDRILNMARQNDDKELIDLLSPQKSFAAIKRELIQSIKQGKANQGLWVSFFENANTKN